MSRLITVISLMIEVLVYTLVVVATAFIFWGVADAEVKIAIIDSGYSASGIASTKPKLCKAGHYDFSTNKSVVGVDLDNHGTLVADIISNYVSKIDVCFLIYKIPFGSKTESSIANAVNRASLNGAKYINISLYTTRYSEKMRRAFARVNPSVKVFIAAGNASTDLDKFCLFYPVCFPDLKSNIKIVGAMDVYYDVAKYSNYGSIVNIWEMGDVMTMRGLNRGTSFASPRALGKYVLDNEGGRK